MACEEEQKQKCPECEVGAPAWMVTFADMVTLLLTFFVLLVSMASMDRVKFSAAASSLNKAFGSGVGATNTSEKIIEPFATLPSDQFLPIQSNPAQHIKKRIEKELKAQKIDDSVEVIKKDTDTIILRMDGSVLFQRNKSSLSPEADPLLRKIADTIRPLPMTLRIEGHTDDTQFSKGERDNWDLSIERSVSVLRFLAKNNLLPLDQMSAIGYGDARSVVPNSSEENRAQNRRVDFILRTAPKQEAPDNADPKAKEIPL
jgi:chemotaxis protein MotB